MLTDLRAALAAGDWVRALGFALDAWRSTRAPALAELVEVIGARVKPPRVPKRVKVLHPWWLARARLQDPADLQALLDALSRFWPAYDNEMKPIIARWANRPTNRIMAALLHEPKSTYAWTRELIERAAELAEWPDDPRIAKVLAEYFLFADPWVNPKTATAVSAAVVERIGEIGDVRILDGIARVKHKTSAVRVRQLLAKVRVRDPGPLLAECLALARPPEPVPVVRPDLDDLWRAVAATPDDLATRAVLGDALVESGDLRGDLIALQCNARTPNRPLRARRTDRYDGRVKTLIRMHWDKWLGAELAAILVKDGCVFRCGMLEVARVGRGNTPASAWDAIRGHRELAAVHTVRPGLVAPQHFAAFVLALPRDPARIVAQGTEVIDELAKRRPRFTTRALDVTQWGTDRDRALVMLDTAERVFPELVELGIDLAPSAGGALAQRLLELRLRFPLLAKVRVTPQTVGDIGPADLGRLRATGWFTVVRSLEEA